MTLFCTFQKSSFLRDYELKMPNFVFHGERKQTTKKFYFAFWT